MLNVEFLVIQVSHVVQERAEGPKTPEAARPFRARGAKLAKIQIVISDYLLVIIF